MEQGRWICFRFDSSQLIPQSRSFGAILFGFDTELDGADATHRVDDLGDATALSVAGRFELVDEIVLVQGVRLHFVNAAVKGRSGGAGKITEVMRKS
jgi:hypothetical protein